MITGTAGIAGVSVFLSCLLMRRSEDERYRSLSQP